MNDLFTDDTEMLRHAEVTKALNVNGGDQRSELVTHAICRA